MCRRLPILTRFLASPAKMLGGFGLVGRCITILYHGAILGLIQPQEAFTNPYRRTEGLDIIDCYNGLGTVIDCG